MTQPLCFLASAKSWKKYTKMTAPGLPLKIEAADLPLRVPLLVGCRCKRWWTVMAESKMRLTSR